MFGYTIISTYWNVESLFIYLFQFWLLQIFKSIFFFFLISHFCDKLPIFKKGLGYDLVKHICTCNFDIFIERNSRIVWSSGDNHPWFLYSEDDNES
jgi:hypothetical protein